MHIRPISQRPLSLQLLRCHGGPLELGRVLDLGTSSFAGSVPEIEDRMSDPSSWSAGARYSSQQLFDVIATVASDSLTEIFGPDLQPHGGRTFVVAEQRGIRSLGCFWAEKQRIEVDSMSKKITFVCSYQPFTLRLPITDIGLYAADHVSVDEAAVAAANEKIKACQRVLVSVGLSRAYRKSNDQPAYHWLQVNNVHSLLSAMYG
ncbi:MAG: hypothetical protein SFV81_15560 [Pirellulaceae bacterium]|nr:hypothetical protein [Pirellulaceae bacterium]